MLMSINISFDPPTWASINRGKLDRLILLAAYQVNESSGALIDKLEARDEGQQAKAKRKA
jgi:hypothetical protein